MWYLDEWHDLVRLGIFLLSLWCCFALLRSWRRNAERQHWTPKTKDYWYALLMWTIVGMVVPVQAIILNRPFTPATVVIIAAVLVTGKGLKQKGSWGGSDE